MLVWPMVERMGGGGVWARWRDCCRFHDGFWESSGKTFHIVVHSRSRSAISFCRLVCMKEVV